MFVCALQCNICITFHDFKMESDIKIIFIFSRNKKKNEIYKPILYINDEKIIFRCWEALKTVIKWNSRYKFPLTTTRPDQADTPQQGERWKVNYKRYPYIHMNIICATAIL